LEVAVMECPFHAGNEAITACIQCETPICSMCAAETNQIHLCLNCYHSRVEELSAGLGSASVRLAKERQKAEVKALTPRKKKKEKAALATAVAAKPAYELGASESLWEKEEMAPVAPGEMAPLVEAAPTVPAAPPVAVEEPPSKKELARMQKEEAKRLREEEKAAKKAAKEAPPEMPVAPTPIPEPAPFFEPAPESPTFAPPPEVVPPPEAAPPPLMDIPPLEFPAEPPAEGVKLPRMDDRLEPLPPRGDSPPGMEPPEGFFD